MTERYHHFTIPVEPERADELQRRLEARLFSGEQSTDLITHPTDTHDSEEEPLMSIDEMETSAHPRHRHRTRLITVGAGLALAGAAAAVALVVVNRDDGGTRTDRPVTETTAPAPATSAAAATTAEGVRRFDVGGYTLPIECHGTGSPTVVYIDGMDTPPASLPAPAFFTEQLPKSQRVCAYDRVGLGTADARPGSLPATVGQGAAELQTLLAAAGESGPFVLVAHGFGGFFAVAFADRYPDLVGGMVMLDVQGVSELVPSTTTRDDGGVAVDLKGSKQELIGASTYGTMPLVVISSNDMPAGDDQRILAIHTLLAAQSADSLHLEATTAGYALYDDNPALVLDAVSEVSAAIRTGDPMPPCDGRFDALQARCLASDQPVAPAPEGLAHWWSSGEVTQDDVDTLLTARGFAGRAGLVSRDLGIPGTFVMGFGNGWFTVGTVDNPILDYGTYEVQGDTLVLSRADSTGTTVLRWSITGGTLSLDVVSDTMPDYRGQPNLLYSLAIYDVATFTPER